MSEFCNISRLSRLSRLVVTLYNPTLTHSVAITTLSCYSCWCRCRYCCCWPGTPLWTAWMATLVVANNSAVHRGHMLKRTDSLIMRSRLAPFAMHLWIAVPPAVTPTSSCFPATHRAALLVHMQQWSYWIYYQRSAAPCSPVEQLYLNDIFLPSFLY